MVVGSCRPLDKAEDTELAVLGNGMRFFRVSEITVNARFEEKEEKNIQ
jgi:hypothetical protein